MTEVENDDDLFARNFCVGLYEDYLGHKKNTCLVQALCDDGNRIVIAHCNRWGHDKLEALLLGLQLVWIISWMVLGDHGASCELVAQKFGKDDLEAQLGGPHSAREIHGSNDDRTKISAGL